MNGFSLPYCSTCKRSYRNIEAHIRTKKHLDNASNATSCRIDHNAVCSICYGPCTETATVKCEQCVHTWCAQCDAQMHRCPFCRLSAHTNPVMQQRARRALNRLFHQMDRWRKRYVNTPTPTVLVRMSWNEVSVLTRLVTTNEQQ